MISVDYAIRDTLGVAQYGDMQGDATAITAVGDATDVSLNISAADIVAYTRSGSDMQITLTSGETIVLEGYFDTTITGEKSLFLSENGKLVEVHLTDLGGHSLVPNYELHEVTGKWSEFDDMVFLDVVEVQPVIAPLAAPLFGLGLGGAAAAVGGAAVIAGVVIGDEGGRDLPADPTVNDVDVDRIVGGDEDDSVTITGTGEPESDVEVTIGDDTFDTTIDEDGTWEVVIEGDDVPDDGVYTTEVVVTNPDGDTDTLVGPVVDIDTTAPEIEVTTGTGSVGDIVNEEEYEADGVVIGGTGEAGATVEVTIGGVIQTTTVGDSGAWSVTYTTSEITSGEYTTDVSITTTDARGNSQTVTDTVVIDTIAPESVVSTVETDDVINAVEAADGVTISGSGEAGSSVSIDFMGSTETTTVGADGTWSVTYGSALITSGEYDATATVTSTDLAGNSAVVTHDIRIDTIGTVSITSGIEGDNIVNAAEAADGITLTGTAEAGSSVVVTMGTVSYTVVSGTDGAWSVDFAASDIPSGTYDATITAVATDGAGNQTTATSSVFIDTDASVAIATGQAGGDDIVNFDEQGSPITFNGTADAGSSVQVTVAGITTTAVVAADGSWTATYAAGTLPAGEYDTTITAVSTDANGNSASATSSITVDTVAGDVALSTSPVAIDDVINASERDGGVDISGTATAGLTVTVTLDGVEHTTVADASGNWTTTYVASEIATGTDTLDITASITDAAGNSKSVSDTVALDTEVVNHTTSTNAVEGDDTINLDELSDGVQFTGTTEPGSSVQVTVGSVTRTATVDSNGNWTVDFAVADIPEGEYSTSVIAEATDAAGNTTTATDTFNVDTFVNELTSQTVETDGTVNAAEMAAGTTLTGTVEAGSSVSVTVQGVTREATVDANGNWSVTFAEGEIAGGEYTGSATINATDAAGNTTSTAATFAVDTVVNDPIVESVTFDGVDVTRVEVENTDSTFEVNTLDDAGNVGTPASIQTDYDSFGTTEFRFSSDVPDGTHLVVTETDAAGNASGTLLVLEDNADNASTIENAGLSDFDIGAIDLDYAVDTNLTLTEEQITAMAENSDSLTITGGSDDTVTIAGASATGETEEINGEDYDIYTVGDDGATVVVDQDVNLLI